MKDVGKLEEKDEGRLDQNIIHEYIKFSNNKR